MSYKSKRSRLKKKKTLTLNSFKLIQYTGLSSWFVHLGFTWHKNKNKKLYFVRLIQKLGFAKQFFGQEYGHPLAKSCGIWQSWCLVLVGEEVVYWYWQRINGNKCFNSQILYWIGHWNTYSTRCNQWIYNWFWKIW